MKEPHVAMVAPVSSVLPPIEKGRSWRSALVAAVAGYAVIAAVLLGVGFLLVGVLGDAGVESFDDSSTEWIEQRRISVLDRLSKVFTTWTDTWTIIAGAAGAIFSLLPRRAWRSATTLFVALIVEISAFLSVTYVVGRTRPEVDALSSVPSTGSWPSGHVAASIVLYGGLALIAAPLIQRHWLRVTAVALGGVLVPAAVGWSRWYRGMHHPTDLVGGIFLGGAALYVGALVARRALPDDLGPDSSGLAESGAVVPITAAGEDRR